MPEFSKGDKVRLLKKALDCPVFSEGEVTDVDDENQAVTVTIKVKPAPPCTPFIRLLAGYPMDFFDHNTQCL